MKRLAWIRWAFWGLLALAGTSACERRAVTETVVDLSADKAALSQSWIAQVAKKPSDLAELAKQSQGWRFFFMGDYEQALKVFTSDLKSTSPELLFDLHAGAARSALALAKVYGMFEQMTHSFGLALNEKQKQIQVDTTQAQSDGGQAEGLKPLSQKDASSVKRKLQLPPKLSQKLEDEDLTGIEGMERLQKALALYYAELALQHCDEAARSPKASQAILWVAADAELILGQKEKALSNLELVMKNTSLPLSLAVLSEWNDVEDLRYAASILSAQLAQKTLPPLPQKRTSMQVWQAWAWAQQGQKLTDRAFPEDRDQLLKLWGLVLAGLTPDAGTPEGAQDVANLQLLDRTVDLWERRFAEAVVATDPNLAVKLRSDAEDKSHAAAPSPRNTYASLVASARDNVAIGRHRVALKYLSRLEEKLPAAGLPAELLRDFLTLQAMEQSSSAIQGQ